jgi:hypothetical protein
MVDQVVVAFEGEGEGVGSLTWSQMGFWQSIEGSGDSRTVGGVTPLPPGIKIEAVTGMLRFVMNRHQVLRTRLVFDGEGKPPLQRCWSSGEVVLEIVDVADGDDAVEVADALRERYQEKHFDYVNEWPVRMGVVRQHGSLTHMVAVYLHLSLDAAALTLLCEDLARWDAETDGRAAGPVTAMQPLEQAARQATPGGQRQGRASLRYLEHVLRTVSPSRFGPTRYGDEPSYRMIRYRSPATLLAAQAVAANGGFNTSPVLLASFAVALARRTGRNPVMTLVTVSNRFRPGLAESVSPVSQVTPLMIDVADITVGEAVTRSAQSALAAYKNAYCDPYEQDEVVERVGVERGEEIDLSCYYNDRRQLDRGPTGETPTAEQIRAALPQGTAHWEHELEMSKAKVYLYVDEAPGAIEFLLSVDTRYFSAEETEALAREMETVAVEAALDPAAATAVHSVPAPV